MKVDGIIHPKEEKYKNKTYSGFSITINDIENIANIDDIQTNPIICGMADENKILAKVLFVGMAEADGITHPKGKEIINHFFDSFFSVFGNISIIA